MSANPKSNVSQNSLSESLDNEIDRLLAAGLENFSVRELLGMMLSAAGQAERRAYLTEAADDKGNGSYGRSVNVGSVPVVIGLHRDGKKKVLGCLTKHGRENLEVWKTVLRSLVERGLRRVMVVVHDDFSGLLGITRGMFPNSDVQLCTVHMIRNAKTHRALRRPTEL